MPHYGSMPTCWTGSVPRGVVIRPRLTRFCAAISSSIRVCLRLSLGHNPGGLDNRPPLLVVGADESGDLLGRAADRRRAEGLEAFLDGWRLHSLGAVAIKLRLDVGREASRSQQHPPNASVVPLDARLIESRHLGQDRCALRGGHGERPQRSGLNHGDRFRHVVEGERNVTTQEIIECRRTALVAQYWALPSSTSFHRFQHNPLIRFTVCLRLATRLYSLRHSSTRQKVDRHGSPSARFSSRNPYLSSQASDRPQAVRLHLDLTWDLARLSAVQERGPVGCPRCE